jgi:hypothetical protein
VDWTQKGKRKRKRIGGTLKALVIIDMINDFVFEEYEYEGEVYFGKLVAPQGKTIVNRITALIKNVVSEGTVSVLRLPKDHYNAL